MAHNVRGADGRLLKSVDAAERRRLAALLRSRGATWKKVAEEYYRGNVGNAFTGVRQFWAEQPVETVEEIRAAMLAKLDGLEAEVRRVMARKHYLVDKGTVVVEHTQDCNLENIGERGRPICGCPRMLDDKPIYEGVDRVRQLVETQLKLIPGLAAPAKVEQQVDSTISYVINATPEELEQL